MKRTQRTFKAIVELLRDGAWHEMDDLKAAATYPKQWVDELRAEGLLDVREGMVTMVRLKHDIVA